MRKSLLCLSVLLLTALAGCVTINVYFPKAAAQKAAGQFIGSVIDQKAAADSKDQNTPSEPSDKNDKSTQDDPHDEPLSSRVIDFLIPAAYAADTPNLRIHTPTVEAIHDRMKQRYRQSMHQLLDNGVVGFTNDGLVAVRDASNIPLSKRARINSIVAAENRDRKALYREIANANGHPDWTSKIRSTFAELWIEKAHNGWYVQNDSGAWTRK